MRRYVLDGRTPKPADDVLEWARWRASADRRVARTRVGRTAVSTVFLGTDHGWGLSPVPILFETMMVDDDGHWWDYQERYATWGEAEEGHARAVGLVRETRETSESDETPDTCQVVMM